ncbi:MAG: hypothetical protein ACYC2H_01410 [Thermoplasmatota archaeon]
MTKLTYAFNIRFTRPDEAHETAYETGYSVVAATLEAAEATVRAHHTHLAVTGTTLVAIVSEDGDFLYKAPPEHFQPAMTVNIIPNEHGNPAGKLADAELRFTAGPLAGLKLIGFAVWERRNGSGRNVTFPARQYSVNGERRSFALLRPLTDTKATDTIRDLVLAAMAKHEADTADGAIRVDSNAMAKCGACGTEHPAGVECQCPDNGCQ